MLCNLSIFLYKSLQNSLNRLPKSLVRNFPYTVDGGNINPLYQLESLVSTGLTRGSLSWLVATYETRLVEEDMRAHLYFYKSMSLFMTHLRCIKPARVHSKSWFGQDPINFFRMSKRFQTFWQIKWKHFECRKKGVESSDIVSERLIFFQIWYGIFRTPFFTEIFLSKFLQSKILPYLMSKKFCLEKWPCRKNSVHYLTKILCTEKFRMSKFFNLFQC